MTIYSSDVFLEGEDANQIEDNEEITLMDWGNVIINKIHREGREKKIFFDLLSFLFIFYIYLFVQ